MTSKLFIEILFEYHFWYCTIG